MDDDTPLTLGTIYQAIYREERDLIIKALKYSYPKTYSNLHHGTLPFLHWWDVYRSLMHYTGVEGSPEQDRCLRFLARKIDALKGKELNEYHRRNLKRAAIYW